MLALEKVSDDPVNNLTVEGIVTRGNNVKKLAEDFIKLFIKEPTMLTLISRNLVGKLAVIVKSVQFLKPASRENMWREVLLLLRDKSILESWKEIINDFENCIFNSMFHYICMELVTSIVRHENQQKEGGTSEDIDTYLSDDEQQVVYYVAGYIIFSLLKKYQKIRYKNPQNLAAPAIIQFLLSLKTKKSSTLGGATFLQFTKKWIELVNRGGLVKVCDELFIFISQIENVMRAVLNLKLIKMYPGEDLREIIQDKLENHPFISKSWEIISRNVANQDLTDIVKKQIIMKWIDIRAQSFVIAYIQILKRKLSSMSKEEKKQVSGDLSKAAEPALRKTLT